MSDILDPKSADGLPAGGELVFPVRPGERRVFSFWTLGDGYDGPSEYAVITIRKAG